MSWIAGVDAPSDEDLVRCVSCGLCLPACPTYRLTGLESASPRGRIAAMRLVAWEGAAIDDTFAEFMDFCLACRACETACPAGVPYGRLIEGARAQVEAGVRRQPVERFLRWLGLDVVLPRRGLLVLVTVSAWAMQRVRLRRPRSLRLLPSLRLSSVLRGPRPSGHGEPSVLFRGCVQDLWFREVNDASARALARQGFRVDIPRGQTCCGALAVHYGRPGTARRLARRNVAALSPTEGPIVVASAGCGASMKEWGHLLEGDSAAAAVAARVRDITEVLADRESPTEGPARPLRIAVHDPCHLAHAQRITREPRIVLSRIPRADVCDVPDSTVCCGAAGLYNLLRPDTAAELGRRKAEAVASVDPDVVAVANPGCAMQIRLWLDEIGRSDIRVSHPVELVDRTS